MSSRRAVQEGTHYGVTAQRLSTQITLLLIMALPLGAVFAQQPAKAADEAVALARRTAAAKVSQPPEKLALVSVSPAQWRDSSLGCPERGLVYTPALTSGFAVRLRDGEQEHVVHVAGGRAVVCGPEPRTKLSSTSTVSASLKAAESVRAALATRLGIEPARVKIESTFPLRADRNRGRVRRPRDAERRRLRGRGQSRGADLPLLHRRRADCQLRRSGRQPPLKRVRACHVHVARRSVSAVSGFLRSTR